LLKRAIVKMNEQIVCMVDPHRDELPDELKRDNRVWQKSGKLNKNLKQKQKRRQRRNARNN
jgi:hypothetical protein